MRLVQFFYRAFPVDLPLFVLAAASSPRPTPVALLPAWTAPSTASRAAPAAAPTRTLPATFVTLLKTPGGYAVGVVQQARRGRRLHLELHRNDKPTEPIGSIPRPIALIDAIGERDGTDPALDPLYEEATRDTIARFEATGSYSR